MPVTVTYPGVYIEELNSLSLSVSTSATAVPVFAVAADTPSFTSTTRISSWMDFLNQKIDKLFDPEDILDLSMRTYFENGGGRCYLVPVGALLSEVPKLNDVTLLVAAGQDITQAVDTLCGNGKCLFAIVDGPQTDLSVPPPLESEGGSAAKSTKAAKSLANAPLAYSDNAFVGMYYPWLRAAWAPKKDIPPSAAMAGVYATVDVTRGVWKAPANVTLKGGVLPAFAVTDELQGNYTKSDPLNMIRTFGNGGPVVWGARTRKPDDNNWCYIPVRRLFNSAERDIKNAMQPAMYEPNNQPTWEQARGAITNYLYRLWQQGALAGTSEQEAFFVQVGKDITMTQEDIDAGKMIVKVGMAAVRPAEFIILQFTQDMAQ